MVNRGSMLSREYIETVDIKLTRRVTNGNIT